MVAKHCAMPSFKVNPFSKSNPDTGFGTQASNIGGRFLNKDGTFNLHKRGIPWLERTSVYSYLLELSWLRFLGLIFSFYLLVNCLFTSIYFLIGEDQLQGLLSKTSWGRIRELFYFSSQTFTTVGYGRINPVRDGADIVASIEAFCGWLFFALVTGLLYGRFSRPRAFVSFSNNALISPFKEGWALMFRMVPYKGNHHLTDARVIVTISLLLPNDDRQEYQFFQLTLERSRIDMFNMNWTVVHPINAESPLLNLTEEDIKQTDLEIMVQMTGFDSIFSNQVTQRTSYTYNEIIWGAKFKPMYHESADNTTTILDLNKLNAFEKLDVVSKIDLKTM